MSALLPLRPYRYEDESLLGYAIRLAKLNAYTNVQQFVKEWSIQKVTLTTMPSKQNRLAQFLGEITGHQVRFDEKKQFGKFTLLNSFLPKYIFSKKPSICPTCIQEDGYIKSGWQFLPESFCTKHKCAHINICPSCKRELKWNVQLLELRCQMCDWKLYSKIDIELPKHITKLNDIEFLKELLAISTSILRPNDMMQKSFIPSLTMSADWNTVFKKANEKIETGKVLSNPYQALFSDNNQYEPEPEYMLSPLKSAYEKATGKYFNNEDSRFFVTKNCLSNLTGISTETLDNLIENGKLVPIFQKPDCRTFIFDIRYILTLFRKIAPLSSDGINLNEFENDVKPFYSDVWKLSLGILLGYIPCSFDDPSTPNLKNAVINNELTLSFLKQRCRPKTSLTIPYKDVAKILNTSPEKVLDLYKSKLLEGISSNNKNVFIIRDSLQKYRNASTKALLE